MSNSENPGIGADFQKKVQEFLISEFGEGFELERKIPIGNPAKDHKFDIVNAKRQIVIECKCYTWTTYDNVPSAKMEAVNEAVFYLSFLPNTYDKYIVMKREYSEKRKETLAEYYFRTYRHLLGTTIVAEYDPEKKELWKIEGNKRVLIRATGIEDSCE